MALGGEAEAARRLGVERRTQDTGLDFARAVLAEAQDRHAALESLIGWPLRLTGECARGRLRGRSSCAWRVASSRRPRRLTRWKSCVRWRGDATEVALRWRTAELRAAAGAPRPALAMLRETMEAMPETRDPVRPRMDALGGFDATLGHGSGFHNWLLMGTKISNPHPRPHTFVIATALSPTSTKASKFPHK